MFEKKIAVSNPNSYHEWLAALAASGAYVEADATKIQASDALAILKAAPATATGLRVMFYNCAHIPWDLRSVAAAGGTRVGFRF
jgi:hypothetical protein